MPEIATPKELFLHELGDILYVEKKLAEETFPSSSTRSPTRSSSRGSRPTSRQTRKHVSNVESVFAVFDEEGNNEKSSASRA